jgi:hypothetical protein
MRYYRFLGAIAALVIALCATPTLATTAQASAPLTCYGSVACAGEAVTTTCMDSETFVEDQQVPGLDDIDLYDSPTCGMAWTTLNVSANGATCADEAGCTSWPVLAGNIL